MGNNWWVTAFILIFAAGYAAFQYFFADKEALAMSGAVEVGREDAPRYFRLVENLCIATGTPMPKLYVVDDPPRTPSRRAANPRRRRSPSRPASSSS